MTPNINALSLPSDSAFTSTSTTPNTVKLSSPSTEIQNSISPKAEDHRLSISSTESTTTMNNSIIIANDSSSSSSSSSSPILLDNSLDKSLDSDSNPSSLPPNSCVVIVQNLPSNMSSDWLYSYFLFFGPIVTVRIRSKSDPRRPGHSTCYGFVHFLSPQSAVKSIQTMNGTFLAGQAITVQFAKPSPLNNIHIDGNGIKVNGNQMNGVNNNVSTNGNAPVSTFLSNGTRDHYKGVGVRDDDFDSHDDNSDLHHPHSSVPKFEICRTLPPRSLHNDANLYVAGFPHTWTADNLSSIFKLFGELNDVRILLDLQGERRGIGFVRFQSLQAAMVAIEIMNEAEIPKMKMERKDNMKEDEKDSGKGVEEIKEKDSFDEKTPDSASSRPPRPHDRLIVRFARNEKHSRLNFHMNIDAQRFFLQQISTPTFTPTAIGGNEGDNNHSKELLAAVAFAAAGLGESPLESNVGKGMGNDNGMIMENTMETLSKINANNMDNMNHPSHPQSPTLSPPSPPSSTLLSYSPPPVPLYTGPIMNNNTNTLSPPLSLSPPIVSSSPSPSSLSMSWGLNLNTINSLLDASGQGGMTGMQTDRTNMSSSSSSSASISPSFLSSPSSGLSSPMSSAPNSISSLSPPLSSLSSSTPSSISDHSIFIFHLPSEFDDTSLYNLFSSYGRVVSASVVQNGHQSRGYGFVRMESEESGLRAIEELNGVQIGRKYLKVEWKKTQGGYQGNNGNSGNGYNPNNFFNNPNPHAQNSLSPSTPRVVNMPNMMMNGYPMTHGMNYNTNGMGNINMIMNMAMMGNNGINMNGMGNMMNPQSLSLLNMTDPSATAALLAAFQQQQQQQQQMSNNNHHVKSFSSKGRMIYNGGGGAPGVQRESAHQYL